MNIQKIVDYELHDQIAVITIDNPPVNALSHPVRVAISDATKQLESDNEAKAGVLICAGRTFFSGAGIDVFFKLNSEWKNRPDDPAYFHMANVLYELGRYGQKTGTGFYKYEGRQAIPDSEVMDIAAREAKSLGITQREVSDDEIIKRLFYTMINEGALILEEGMALRPGDIDVIYANGYGFPRHRGGPMFYADSVGLPEIYESICKYRDRYGDLYWTPAPLLKQLVEQNQKFSVWSK